APIEFTPSLQLTNKRNGTTYRRLCLLGRGATSSCFAVLSLLPTTRTARLQCLACKALPKCRLIDSPAAQQRLAREIRLHSSLPKHRHVLQLIDWFEDSDVISLRGAVSQPEAQFYLRQLFDGCQHLHRRCGVAHRDLKPSNLVLTERMLLRIADFGFACRPAEESGSRQPVCGTLAYMAPELLGAIGSPR
uniref:Protein kinase domain-containing protein n=1 Tax=Macrostomum lignano TaxID=282301 RepID=A0A1I8GH43_9PLAT